MAAVFNIMQEWWSEREPSPRKWTEKNLSKCEKYLIKEEKCTTSLWKKNYLSFQFVLWKNAVRDRDSVEGVAVNFLNFLCKFCEHNKLSSIQLHFTLRRETWWSLLWCLELWKFSSTFWAADSCPQIHCSLIHFAEMKPPLQPITSAFITLSYIMKYYCSAECFNQSPFCTALLHIHHVTLN